MQDRTFNCWSRHHSSYTSQHTPLIIHHSSYTTHHTPLNIHHSSFITRHTPHIITQHWLQLIVLLAGRFVLKVEVLGAVHTDSIWLHFMRDRFYMPIRIPCTLMCGMKGLPPLKNATVGCVSMWTASLASRGGRMCVISRRGHTHLTHVESRGSKVRSACV